LELSIWNVASFFSKIDRFDSKMGDRPIWVLLLLGLASIPLIPWAPFFGYDLYNIQVYHKCPPVQWNPYLPESVQCGDHAGRSMPYPPLLYFSFIWTKYLSPATSKIIWGVVLIALMSGSLLWWLRQEREDRKQISRQDLAFGLLLLLQFPFIFTLERANSDVPVVALWTVATWAATKNRWAVAGMAAGAAVTFKIYPIIALGVISLGTVITLAKEKLRKHGLVLGLVSALTMFIGFYLLWPQDIWNNWLVTIGGYNTGGSGTFYYSHTLSRPFGGKYWIPALIIRTALFGIFVWATKAKIKTDPRLVFAGALAMTTYYTGTSYDYNLVTIYPLFILLYVRKLWSLLGIGLFFVCMARPLFVQSPGVQILGQIGWLMLIALYCSTSNRTRKI